MLHSISFNTLHNLTMNQVVNANVESSKIKRISSLFVWNLCASASAAGATFQNTIELAARTVISPVAFVGARGIGLFSTSKGRSLSDAFSAKTWLNTAKNVAAYAAATFTSLTACLGFTAFNIRLQEETLHTFSKVAKIPNVPNIIPVNNPEPEPVKEQEPEPVKEQEPKPTMTREQMLQASIDNGLSSPLDKGMPPEEEIENNPKQKQQSFVERLDAAAENKNEIGVKRTPRKLDGNPGAPNEFDPVFQEF